MVNPADTVTGVGRSLLTRLPGMNREWGTSPASYRPELIDETLRTASHLFGPGRYFPIQVQGLENVPEGPVMIVGNHSGGTSIPDVWGLFFVWYERFGSQRPLHGMAHEMVFAIPALARFFGERGILRADPELGREVLEEYGRDLLVTPGGDLEVWRPYFRRHEVDFGGRTGYARLAVQTGVPIVPLAHRGAHETLMVLTDGRRLAQWLRLPQLARASIFPVSLSLPWGLAVGPLPHIPVPTTLRYAFGDIIDPRGKQGESVQAAVARVDAQTRASIQEMLWRLADGGEAS